MGADSYHLTFVQHHNLLGVHDGGNTLGNNQYRRVFGISLQRLAQLGIGLKIERGEGVVKDIDRRLFDQRTCDGQSLPLSARNVGSALADRLENLGADAATITAETSFKDDLHADSLDLFELAMAFEEEFSVEIPSEDLEQITTVADVMNYLTEHQA